MSTVNIIHSSNIPLRHMNPYGVLKAGMVPMYVQGLMYLEWEEKGDNKKSYISKNLVF